MSAPPGRKRQRRATGDGAPETPAGSPAASNANTLGRHAQKRINDNLNDTNKRAVVWIWNYLNEPENQAEILMCKEHCSNGLFKVSKGTDSDNTNAFHATYVSFASLPKYWIAAFMVQHVDFTAACVDQLNGNGKEGRLKHVWSFITGIDDYTHWPANVHDKVLLVKFLQWMMQRLGNRHTSLTFGVDFKIDWDKCGPYKLTWGKRGDMVCVVSILHKQTTKEAM